MNRLGTPVAGATVSNTRACDSGTASVSGTVADNGTGTVTISFNDCRTGNETLTGTGTAQVNAYDRATNTITDMVASFPLASMRGTGISLRYANEGMDEQQRF